MKRIYCVATHDIAFSRLPFTQILIIYSNIFSNFAAEIISRITRATVMVSKTRDKLIEVARQLFVYKGVENTTMNDIAAASDKGRRTIYTYFKNKREIFNAVVEKQSDAIISRLQEVVLSDLEPEEKLRAYLKLRFKVFNQSIPRVESKAHMLFTRDHRRNIRINQLALVKERALFTSLLHQGVEAGAFDAVQAQKLPWLHALAFQASDYLQSNGMFESFGADPDEICGNMIDFIVTGLRKSRKLSNE